MEQKKELTSFLKNLGWNDLFQESFDEKKEPHHFPGRVVNQGKGHYHVQIGPQAIIEASITSKLRHEARTAIELPGVGDWVSLTTGQGTTKAHIHRVLQRKTLVQRKRSGSAQEPQLIVANVDFVFLTTSLNEDFDIERLFRYLTIARESGAQPILLLTKVDLCKTPEVYTDQLNKQLSDTYILKISKHDTNSMENLKRFFAPGMTSVLLGSSGVGKSTLTNFLLGSELQKTQNLSGETKGRHTTTSRNLFITRWGGMVIDTPGMQEVAMVDPSPDRTTQFADIEQLILQCKFTNCRHGNEPGCAVSSALKNQTLHIDRWNEFKKTISDLPISKKLNRSR